MFDVADMLLPVPSGLQLGDKPVYLDGSSYPFHPYNILLFFHITWNTKYIQQHHSAIETELNSNLLND